MVMDESNCPLLGYNFDTSTYSLVDGPTRCAECQGLRTRTPDQQAIDDVKLLRAACLIDRDEISIDADWDEIYKQRWTLIKEALAATDRPEYQELTAKEDAHRWKKIDEQMEILTRIVNKDVTGG